MMTKKKDDTITKREALALAWKSRKDYKGYDRSKGSAFNSWRAIIRTEKGRVIGFPESWSKFDVFMSEVHGEWAHGKIVCRLDVSLPHGPANSVWSERGQEAIGKLVKLEYEGQVKTLLEWCKQFGLNYNGVRQRFFRGKDFTSHEVLFGKQKKLRSTQQRSEDFRALRMLGAYRLRDKRKGLDSDLTIGFLRDVQSKGCFYCGDIEKVGLDRIDNMKGHTQDNVVPCCYVCNCARMDNFSVDEMKKIGSVIREIKESRNANREK